jgi:predicted pyridoxine 5'-phosphate oxidase superfamily flavin-nucleotide-binding protein
VIELTDEIMSALNNSFADRMIVMVATAAGDGMPDIAFRGSAFAYDREHIAFWERALGQTFRNLVENPQICLQYRNTETRQAWKFFGTAAVLTEGEKRADVMSRTVQAELDRDPERKGAAIVVRVDKVIQAGQVLMER